MAINAEPTSKNTLLIVEDNLVLQDFMYELFKSQFRVLTASNGLEGLDLAKKRVPDLIISDIMMPGMNGIELCKQVKSSIETSHIPVILSSAKGAPQQILDGLMSGADDYFVKPFDVSILEFKVQNILKTQRALSERYQKNSWFVSPTSVTIEDDFLVKLKVIIVENMAIHNFGVNELASAVGMSVSVLYRKLRALTGYTVNEFIKLVRINESATLLKSGQYQIAEVALLVGYDDAKYFSKEFKKVFGNTPSKYLKTSVDSLDDSIITVENSNDLRN
jgi:YesN/AraC family two-component response regulator